MEGGAGFGGGKEGYGWSGLLPSEFMRRLSLKVADRSYPVQENQNLLIRENGVFECKTWGSERTYQAGHDLDSGGT